MHAVRSWTSSVRNAASKLAVVGVALLASARALAAPVDTVLSMVAEKKPSTEIIEVVHQNKGAWMPRDVYTLIDKQAPTDVIKAVAAHAVVFYDGTSPKSLDAIAAEARAGMPPQTVRADDPIVMFEWFADVKADSDALRATVPPVTPQKPGETPAQFDVRKRQWDEDLVRTLAPVDGKIDTTTFLMDLPATFALDAKNCAVGTAKVSLDAVNYFTFRTAMGSTLAKVPVAPKKSRSIAGGEFFNGGEAKYLLVTSKPVCGEPAGGLVSGGGKAKLQLSRTSKGGDWTAAGEFTNKGGEPVPAGR